MAQKKTVKTKSYNIADPRVIVGIVVVVSFAIFGLYKLATSSAATANTQILSFVQDWHNIDTVTSKNVSLVSDRVWTNTDQAIQIDAGGGVEFGGSGGMDRVNPVSEKACYVLRAVDGPATVKIRNLNGKTRTVALKGVNDPTMPVAPAWQYECTAFVAYPSVSGSTSGSATAASSATSGTKATYAPFAVENLSGNSVRLYRVEWISKYAN